MQAFHRAQDEQDKQAADAAALAEVRDAAFEEGKRAAENAVLLADDSCDSTQTFSRSASIGCEDPRFCVDFNELVLERDVDGWQKTTRTLPINLQFITALLLPFLAVSRLQRTEDDFGHVLLSNGERWTTTFGGSTQRKITFHLAGFDGYSASQHASDSVDERDIAQRMNIVMFLPWVAWADTFPQALLPVGFSDSATWAAKVQAEILAAVQQLFDTHSVPWDPLWEILYIHLLNQKAGASRFKMHRDVEEDSNKFGKGYRLRVHHTVVLLLEKGSKKVPGMFVAGAPKMATYPREMLGHVFNAALFHTTEPMRDGKCSGVKLGVFIGRRF
jgi:hypothetical protein